jgi:hypothetical protein
MKDMGGPTGSPPKEEVQHLVHLLGGRWTLTILGVLAEGGRRYQDLHDALDGISNKVLTDTLRRAGGARSFEPDYVKIREVLTSGTLGQLLALNTTCYTPWMIRPRLPYEVDVTEGGGTVYNQAPHSIDVMRLLGGGKVRSLRGTTVGGMTSRPCPSYFTAYLEFEDGTPGTITYDGSGYVQGWEFVPWGESGVRRGASEAGYAYRRQLKAGTADEAAAREGLRFGGFEGLRMSRSQSGLDPQRCGNRCCYLRERCRP